VEFTDPPTKRGGRLLRFGGKKETDGQNRNSTFLTTGSSPDVVNDDRAVFLCKILHDDRLGGFYTLFTETSQARSEWKAKLEEAIWLRKVVRGSSGVSTGELEWHTSLPEDVRNGIPKQIAKRQA
jgi:hypothetical protein